MLVRRVGCVPMVQRIDYYALLSRAVEWLERDAYGTRGAIYDREHKALLKRLISSASPCSDADIAREERAFRDAIRRIEFPDEDVQAPRIPQRDPAAGAAWPGSARERARALRRELPQAPAEEPEPAPPPEAKRATRRFWGATRQETDRKPLGRREPAPESTWQDAPGWTGEERKSRSFVGLAAAYVLVTVIVLGAASLGYAYVAGALDLSWLALWPSQAAQSERAILYEGGQAGRNGQTAEGNAIWRTRMEPNGPDGKPEMVVTLAAEIPEQHIALTMSLSRVGDAGAGMSHLLELSFAKPEELPFGGISRISNIAMKGAETEAGESLVGTSINIAPGHFMFGLLGVADVVRQNVQRLRTQNWLDFTIIFASGAAYTLTIEKGASGERAINEAFASWAQ
jgi:hypothetical protein